MNNKIERANSILGLDLEDITEPAYIDLLCDGAALLELGLGDDDQEAIEMAYAILTEN